MAPASTAAVARPRAAAAPGERASTALSLGIVTAYLTVLVALPIAALVWESTSAGGESFHFDIDPFRKHCILNGLDDIGLTLAHADEIRAFEQKHKQAQPWLFS